MKRRFFSVSTAIVLSLVLVFSCAFPVFAQPQDSENVSWAEDIPAMLSAGSYAEGEVIVGVAASGASITGDDLLAESEELFDVTGADIDDPSVTVADQTEIDIVFIQRDDMSTEEILYRLAGKRNVVFAEPNYLMETQAVKKTGAEKIAAETVAQLASPEARTASVRLNNYPDLTPQQWSSWDGADYIIEGQGGNSIHVPNFDTQSGNMEGDPVVVAVVDIAIDFSHPDLVTSAYTFTEEQQRILECDAHGFNAAAESTDGILTYYPEQSHGTHCAGIIGAAWDGQGISGVASNVKLVSIQICVENGYTSLVNGLRAYDFIDRANELGCGISITSNSWGDYQGSRALDAAIRHLGEKWGVISIFAAANDSRDIGLTGINPASLYDNPYAIIVAAMNSDGKIATYSNYGETTVDLGAPGSGILSTILTNSDELQYFADATPDTNKYYNGFEDGQIPGLKWIDMNGEETAADAQLTDDSHFAGSKGLKITLPEKKAGEYTLEIDLGDVTVHGVETGDLAGFTFGTVGFARARISQYMNESTHEWEDVPQLYFYQDPNCWINPFFEIPENADLTDLKFRCSVYCYDDLGEAVYLDSLGIGTELVPYRMMDGTSMACPCVAGFAAVLKSQYPQASGAELADLVKARVRPNESLAGITKTGGVIDFLVDGTPGSAMTAFNPQIRNVTVSGRSITVTGSDFTDSGNAVVSKYVAGKEKDVKAASVVSWTDTEVVLSLAEDFQGIMEVNIENKDGKIDTYTVFVSKSDNLYEEELPFDKSTGEPYVFDADGDYESLGPLIGLDNKLYYLPAYIKTEHTPAYKRMRCFDIASQTWAELPEIPEWLTGLRAVMFDGKIVVKGVTMVIAPDGSPQRDETNYQIKVYYYDPNTGAWSEGSAENVYDTDTIANNDGQLILVGGGGDEEQKPSSVRKYDLSTGAGEVQYELLDGVLLPHVACRNGSIYIFNTDGYNHQRVHNGTVEYLTDAMPAYLDSTRNSLWEYTGSRPTEFDGYFVPVSEGILFMGPTAADGSGDTYILRDGSDRFELYEKRMSDCKVNYVGVASYRGYVYAIGTAFFEPGQVFFRRTAIDVPEYPGDVPQKDAPDTPDTPDIPDAPGTPDTPKTPLSPKTGDGSNLSLWFLLLALSTGGAAGAAVIRKRLSEQTN